MNLKKIEKTDNKVKLMKWAMKVSYDTDIRLAAVRKITDQNMLHTIARDVEHGGVAVAAAKKLDNQYLAQKVYAGIVKNGSFADSPRIEAINLITGQEVLADIVQKVKSEAVALAAVKRVTRQEALAGIVSATSFESVAAEAVVGVTGEKFLYNIAHSTSFASVGEAALYKIQSNKDINSLALEAKCWEVRLAAVLRVNDQKILEKIVMDDNNDISTTKVKEEAVKRINNQSFLYEIASADITVVSSSVALAAIDMLTDKKRAQQLCFQIVTNSTKYACYSKDAFERLEKGSQEKFDTREEHNDYTRSIGSCLEVIYRHTDFESTKYDLKPGALPPYPEKK